MVTPRILLLPLLVGVFFAVSEWLRRRNPERFEPVVRCEQGHLYRSIWVPGGSLKAVRWFDRRYQWCPVGRHWSWTRRVDERDLSEEERRSADAVHDLRVA
jgi:hypothetical protein